MKPCIIENVQTAPFSGPDHVHEVICSSQLSGNSPICLLMYIVDTTFAASYPQARGGWWQLLYSLGAVSESDSFVVCA